MFRWNLMLRTVSGSQGQQSKACRRQTTVKPHLEELTPRILPSASSLPTTFEASPPTALSLAAITSSIFSIMESRAELFASIEQNVIGVYEALDQEIAQAISSVQQQWDSLLGIDPSSANSSQATLTMRPGNARGHTVSNPSTTDAMPPSASAGHG